MSRPRTILILAMSADGKIAREKQYPARFSSHQDKTHLEKQIALVDGVLFGANTLRSYGTTLPISDPKLLQQREKLNLPPQPVHIVCSASGKINPELRFFQQKVPRWLLTTTTGASLWENQTEYWEKIVIAAKNSQKIDWLAAFSLFTQLNWQKLAILGGGELVASLLELKLIDEFYLTLCPIIFGGVTAPTPVGGMGLSVPEKLELLSVERVDNEIFLHYRLHYEEI